MNYLSPIFYIFLPFFLLVFYLIPQRYRYIPIFIGSYIFYGYTDIKMSLVLLAITVLSYFGGIIIEKRKSRGTLGFFFLANILVLFFFKYTNFTISNVNWIISRAVPQLPQMNQPKIILPVGLSFIVFQSCTYLTDVFRNNIEAEHNFIRYGAFVAFFPTVLSGPIQKARELLPQIACPGKFDGMEAKKGTLLFIWGMFEKIMIANKLLVIVNKVFNNYQSYNSAYCIIAAISFSLYIYADFSSYSDMARGIAKMMGINIGKNFDNPYLSLTTCEFWNRWHMSLNSWFLENVYIPLGGNRKGILRKYINTMIVFLISGLWHGASYHYIVWGVINGVFVIIGQLLRPLKESVYKRLKIDENVESIRLCKRIVVFLLITITWVFFRNGISEALYVIKCMIFLNPLNFFDSDLFQISETTAATFVTFMAVVVFCRAQSKRQNEKKLFEIYNRQPILMQCIPVSMIICACIFAVFSTDANINTQFLYFQF